MGEAAEKRWKYWLFGTVGGAAAIMLLLTAVLAAFWFGSAPRMSTEPMRLVRDENGRMVPADGGADAESGLRFEAQAGTLEANNSFSFASMGSRGSGARFACRRLAVFNESDHLLMARVGPLVVERLSKLPYVEQIDYFPAGRRSEPGTAAPDLFVRLNLASIQESSGPLSRKLDAKIEVHAGNGWSTSNHSYHDGMQPPLVQMRCNGQLDHRSTTSGMESSAARYKQAAENIAEQIAAKLKDQFDKNYQQDGPVPPLPSVFYPEYCQPPELPILTGRQAELVASHHGLLTRTDALWQLTVNEDGKAFLDKARADLEKAGWRWSTSSDGYLRMTKDSQVLTVYAADANGRPASNAEPQPQAAATYYVRYMDILSREEQSKAIADLAAQGHPLETLLMFRDRWSDETRRKIFERLQREPPKDAEALLLLAEHYGEKQRDKALQALRRASILASTLAKPDDVNKQIRKALEKLGEKDAAQSPPDAALLEEMGFKEIKLDAPAPEAELSPERPAHFFIPTADGWPKLLTLRIEEQPGKDQPRYQLAHVEKQKGGRSWGSGGLSCSMQVDDVATIHFLAQPIDAAGKYRVTMQIQRSRESGK